MWISLFRTLKSCRDHGDDYADRGMPEYVLGHQLKGEGKRLALMSELLDLSGVQVPTDAIRIFDSIRAEVPLYSGIEYESIGLLGTVPASVAQEVLR